MKTRSLGKTSKGIWKEIILYIGISTINRYFDTLISWINLSRFVKDYMIISFHAGMKYTKVCPKNQTEVNQASKRLKCGYDKYGNNQYICLPNKDKTSLVEFCNDGVMGLTEKGKCCTSKRGKNKHLILFLFLLTFLNA